MKTIATIFDGRELIVPFLGNGALSFPFNSFAQFPTYCGAGKGIGDKIVSDHIDGIKISPACYIHDVMFDIAKPCWADFHHSNSVFLHNILAILEYENNNHKSEAIMYYIAVDTIGAHFFWKNKKEQGYDVSQVI